MLTIEDNIQKVVLQFDAEWCANTLVLENNNMTIKKYSSQHGIVFCKTLLDVFCSYIEFKVT
jgi:hypothetical protein